MRLRSLAVGDEAQARLAHEELMQDGFEFLLELEQGEAWRVYLERLESLRLGVDLADGEVPATFLVAEVEGHVVGRVSIRHELNAHLAEVGGTSAMEFVPVFVAAVTRRRCCARHLVSREGQGLSAC